MNVRYDPVADAAFIYLTEAIPAGGAPKSHICDLEIENGSVILLFSPDDRLVDLEILGASRILPSEVLARSE